MAIIFRRGRMKNNKQINYLNNAMEGAGALPHLIITYGEGTIYCLGDIELIGGFQFDYKQSSKEKIQFNWNFGERMGTEIFVNEAKDINRVLVYKMNKENPFPDVWCTYSGNLLIDRSTFLIASWEKDDGGRPMAIEYGLTTKSEEFPKSTGGTISKTTKPFNEMTNRVGKN